ncbi:hypothetical protein EYR40_008982 [Pleurotus pulmonarius]|nr:hypothetical protein EYR36_009804 [Pleurotus pulmonarius]KAF4594179.1 hypothetical protein EYR40_008982 [Pleurotus pulmonarius]
MRTPSTRPQVPLNLLTFTSLSLVISVLLSAVPSTVASGLQHRAPVHAHAHHHKYLNRSKRTDSGDVIHRKRSGTQYTKRALPEGWAELGCMSDGPGPRTFIGASEATAEMTHESCVAFCDSRGFIYAGIEFGNECYCDNSIHNTGALVEDGCNMPCAGDDEQICGGPNRMTVLKSDAEPPVLVEVQTYNEWTTEGCYTDSISARTLPTAVGVVSGPVTVGRCIDTCQAAGFFYAGVEFGAGCYCGNAIANGAPSATGCDMPCAGDVTQLCGGADRINVYSRPGAPNPPGGGEGDGDGDGDEEPENPQNVPGWTHLGCHTDTVAVRSLTGANTASATMTPATCAAFCSEFEYAGLEYGAECFCGNTLGGASAAEGCTMPCAGAPTAMCGGPDRMNLYQVIHTLPAGWSEAGCYTDSVAARSLTGANTAGADMTHMKCASHCAGLGFTYAGAEYGAECFCGNELAAGAAADVADCNMPCSGDATQFCGGPNRMNLFVSDGTPPPDPEDPEEPPEPAGPAVEVPAYGQWTTQGCTIDNNPGRSLPIVIGVPGAMTIEKCLDACFNAGYGFAGTEYAAECYCGEAPAETAAPATDGCNMACAGNAEQLCGGPNRLNMYSYGGDDLPPITPPAGPGDPPTEAPPPVTEGLPEPWHYAGCWVDQEFGRILTFGIPDVPDRTVEQCVDTCQDAGYTLAGLEYGVQCFCGNEVRYAGRLADNENECNMPCGGDDEHACGAGNRLSIYSSTEEVAVYPVPAAKTEGLPGNWEYQGCFAEPAYPLPRTYLHQIVYETDMTAERCLNRCAEYGYLSAGFEFGKECYCGDPEDVTTHATLAPEADCNIACNADPAAICGGPLRMTVYSWIGGGNTVWHHPENTGHYEFLIGAPMVALQTTLGINNKVTFLEKLGSGPENSTHAYELDYTLANDVEHAWREMHVLTDIFCSAGSILPDKAGRQLNVGGWSLDSTYGLRLYTPDGSLGVNGTNDWEEDVTRLSLQRGRWYPTSMVMSNGSVVVVGGQIGANDIPEPTLEVLPKPEGGPTYLYMDWLERTDPWNLYPFMHVLPGGGIYVQYHNEAIILDPVTFGTDVQLPILPGAVDKPGGRTYPLEGTGVMFPIHAPYTDPVTMMSCGGSDDFYGLDNCVTIQPEVEGSTWTIERMPFRRVMSNMVSLPDGTFLIVNGARQGQAGFGLAIEPVLTALLYDPYQPLHERISVLDTTIVARMYHSEAILLHDGRVMISGSDPLDPRFPEEHRVEVYIPPYLESGLPQPTFTITDTDWEYGVAYTVVITSATSINIRASLIGAETSTHGNNMGQRTIFPAISCVGLVCEITAPPDNKICPPGWFQLFILDGPTPSYSVWVRIGGDPGQLGNWPNIEGFELPGL